MGIPLKDVRITLSLYADDVLIYLVEPEKHLQGVMQKVEEFSGVSGLTLNLAKSIIAPLNRNTDCPRDTYGLTWSPDGFKYLGIQFHIERKVAYERNFEAQLGETKCMVERWIKLPLDIMARISLVKMILVPKWLYIFVNTPVAPPCGFFRRLKTVVLRLVWAGKQAWVRYDILVLSMEQGGLGLPDLERYYQAAQMQFISRWFTLSENRPHKWAETSGIARPDPRAQLLLLHRPRPFRADMAATTIGAMYVNQKWMGNQVLHSPCMPLCFHPQLSLHGDVSWIKYLKACGKSSVADMFIDEWLVTDVDLDSVVPMSGNIRLKYIGMKIACKRWLDDYPFEPQGNVLFAKLTDPGESTLTVSTIYSILGELGAQCPAQAREKWERVLERALTENEWKIAMRQVRDVSSNYKFRVLQFKILHQVYYTPLRLAKFYPSRSTDCPRCGMCDADFVHLLWRCAAVYGLWTRIHSIISKATGVEVPLEMAQWVLGLFTGVAGQQRKLFSIAAAVCKLLIAKH